MLEKIVIKNFKSFSKETVIDFAKTNYSFLPQNCSDDGILKGTMFVGANASGKSNVLIAIKLLLDMLFLEKNINSDIYKCIFNSDPRYSLDYYFKVKGSTVQYEFIVETNKSIISERLFIDKKMMLDRLGNNARVFITEPNGIIYSEDDVDGETLFLRTLYFNTKFAGNTVLKEWMEYLTNSVYLNAYEQILISYGKHDLNVTSYLKKNGSEKINALFNAYNFKQNIEYINKEGENSIFFKRADINEPIPFSMESTGNKNLLRMLPSFLTVVESGGMILIDEFSSGFHNELETLLVKYFMKNAEHSQMIFVSHSTNLLNNSILRPDQEYAVEFNGREGTTLKRFSSEQPRAAQNIEKMYVSGVFGGLPGYKKESGKD
ncbi:MAG: ATP-binding protein [Spirochaetales bacterium]|nr:ATP-binding protein [Spirochaetales bacterium]